MKILSMLSPFIESRKDLGDKWWHRFFVVLHNTFFILLFIFLFTVGLSGDEGRYLGLGDIVSNVTINKNLSDFVKKNPSEHISSDFSKKYNLIGCLENGKVYGITHIAFEKNYLCTSAINKTSLTTPKRMKYMMTDHLTGEKKVVDESELGKYGINKPQNERFDVEGNGCMIIDTIQGGCDNWEHVVAYERNFYFYLKSFLFSIFVVYVLSYILRLIYYKGFIYIIYGNKK